MERIRELARRLGDAIAAHERCAALKSAREAFEKDEAAQQLQKEYDEAAEVLRRKMAANTPLEPEEKRREADLRQQVASNAVVRDLLKAQVDFTELMNEVNRAIDDAVST